MLDEASKKLVDGVVREDDILEENVTSLCGSTFSAHSMD